MAFDYNKIDLIEELAKRTKLKESEKNDMETAVNEYESENKNTK